MYPCQPQAAKLCADGVLVKSRPTPSVTARQAVRNAVLLCLVVAILVALSYQAFEAVSAARAYVGGEARWSSSQKDAVYHLEHYALTRDRAEYNAFLAALAVPEGDREARLELDRDTPDWTRVRAGFLQGKNHPDDVERMSALYRRFHSLPFLRNAVTHWVQGDSLILELRDAGSDLHAELEQRRPDPSAGAAARVRIHDLNESLSVLEVGFAAAIGEGARMAGTVGYIVIAATALFLLIAIGLSEWRSLQRAQKVERSILESEMRHRELVEHANIGIVRSSADGVLLQVNLAMARLLGYRDEADLLSRRSAHRIYRNPPDRDRVLQHFATGESHGEFEFELLKRDGDILLVKARARAIRGADGVLEGLETFVEDVTGQRALEAQLRQSQKMEAVGQLTGGIAHDFNNLLSVITSTAQLAEEALTDDVELAREELQEIRSAARRGADMIRKLLAFSRTRQLHFRPYQLSDLVAASTDVLRRLLPEHIQVRLDAPPVTPHVRTDPAALEQILLNLATNARDAMPTGGVLDISVTTVARHETGDGPWVLLTVGDNGVGMDVAVRERLYEPFFTTKQPGQGTGLGMTMVYGLMKQHGGVMEVESTLGEGTTIRLYFPLALPDHQLLPAGAVRPAPGSGTVLLVEDEAALRRAAQRLLERNGYRVLTAVHGEEAMGVYFRHAGAIDLVLSDVVMPHMSGGQLYNALRAQGEQVPFIFMSGYIGEEGHNLLELPEGVPLLPKPWGVEDLLHRVAAALTGARDRVSGANAGVGRMAR
jgi:PAS domain S-box-containing protein